MNSGLVCKYNDHDMCRHPQLCFQTMNVLVQGGGDGEDDRQRDVVFLYRLVQGLLLFSLNIDAILNTEIIPSAEPSRRIV